MRVCENVTCIVVELVYQTVHHEPDCVIAQNVGPGLEALRVVEGPAADRDTIRDRCASANCHDAPRVSPLRVEVFLDGARALRLGKAFARGKLGRDCVGVGDDEDEVHALGIEPCGVVLAGVIGSRADNTLDAIDIGVVCFLDVNLR